MSTESSYNRTQPSIFPFLQGLGIAFIFIAPILYGLAGFIGGCLVALLYNLGAKFLGGIKLEIEQVVKTA